MATGITTPVFGDNYKVLGVGNNQLTVAGATGYLLGIWCSSTSSGTIAVYDDAATGTTTNIIPTTTIAGVGWNPMPFQFQKGANVVIGGTFTGTAVWSKLP